NALVVTPTATDADGDTLTFLPGSASHGTVTKNLDGTFTYTPNANFHGTDSFNYTASDSTNTSHAANVTMTVMDNSVPAASAKSVSTNENTPILVIPTATDTDGDILSFAIAANPTNGIVTSNSNSTFTYTPNSNFHGTDSFTYTSNDGNNTSSAATVTLTVVDNSIPVANSQSKSTNENTAIGLTLGAIDSDNDALTYAITNNPSHGSLSSFNAATGVVTYTPNVNYHGNDSFIFTASDGINTSPAATVTMTV